MFVTGPGTIDDLIADSERLGYPLTERAIRDWIERGLIDHAPARGAGLGRGSGSERAMFTPNQRQLLQSLIPHRKRGASPKSLTSIPIYLWLYWGDDYVSIRQVRRALRTFAPNPRMTVKQARIAADGILAQWDNPNAEARARIRLRQEVIESCTRAVVNEERLSNALAAVFSPGGYRATSVLPDPAEFVTHVKYRVELVRRLDELTDEDYIRARREHAYHWNVYLGGQRQEMHGQASPHLQAMFNEPDISDVVNNSGSTVMTLLALAMQHRLAPKT